MAILVTGGRGALQSAVVFLPHASCPHYLMRERDMSRLANYSVEDTTPLPRGAASGGICRLEVGPGCPSHSQRREATPVAGHVVTNWSSWAGGVMQARVQRRFPVMELSQAAPSGWNMRQSEIMTELKQ